MGANATAPIKRFGDWSSKVKGTNYQADSDGFVIAEADYDKVASGYTDGDANPTTLRGRCNTINVTRYSTICMPVKKNDYWRVDCTGDLQLLYWIPLLP